jgi:hypothetical protein
MQLSVLPTYFFQNHNHLFLVLAVFVLTSSEGTEYYDQSVPPILLTSPW